MDKGRLHILGVIVFLLACACYMVGLVSSKILFFASFPLGAIGLVVVGVAWAMKPSQTQH